METYNGWKNYATWRIALEWFQDDDHIHELAKHCEGEYAIYDLSQELKRYVLDSWEEYSEKDNPFMDYAYAFLQDVFWYEIAEHYFNENKQSEKE